MLSTILTKSFSKDTALLILRVITGTVLIHHGYEKLANIENFVVLNFKIDSVDLLKLEQPIHKRYIWEKNKKWEKTEINP